MGGWAIETTLLPGGKSCMQKEGYERIFLASERSEPPQAGVSFARVACLKK